MLASVPGFLYRVKVYQAPTRGAGDGPRSCGGFVFGSGDSDNSALYQYLPDGIRTELVERLGGFERG